MGRRRRAREMALQALYQIDLVAHPLEAVMEDFLVPNAPDAETLEFARMLVEGTLQKQPEIDAYLRESVENWELERIAVVDRNILRMASYEMLYLYDIPANVSINEAVELAKKFSTSESGRFVNGVLDRIKKPLLPGIF